MRGLLFAVFFCAISLLFAEALTTLLINLSIIRLNEFDKTHSLIMVFMLVVYMVAASTFIKDFKRHNKNNKKL